MNAKDKAYELINKHREFINKTYANGEYWPEDELENAKECTLITIEQVLDVIGYPTLFHETKYFWEQVKKEVELIKTFNENNSHRL